MKKIGYVLVTGSVVGEKTLNNKLIRDAIHIEIGVPFIVGISAFCII